MKHHGSDKQTLILSSHYTHHHHNHHYHKVWDGIVGPRYSQLGTFLDVLNVSLCASDAQLGFDIVD